MESQQTDRLEDKPQRCCPEVECFEYLEKLYSKTSSMCDIESDCSIKSNTQDKKNKTEEICDELNNRRCLLEKEIIGNCAIAEKLSSINNPANADRVYKLSVTDMFVEKAIYLLNDEAKKHEDNGNKSFNRTHNIIIIGALVAFIQMFGGMEYLQKRIFDKSDTNQTAEIQLLIQKTTQCDITIKKTNKSIEEHNISKINENIVRTVVEAQVGLAWKDALMTFTKSFTFYGLLVLAAVFLKRQGKASLDQAERIKDKRHALREGRLYIHLKNGQIRTVKELEEAFNWNSSQQNAFSEINTEAQAPWGRVFKGISDTFAKTVEFIMKNKNQGEKPNDI